MWSKSLIKNTALKNRFVRSATNEHLGTSDGLITEDYINCYEELAANGTGLLITSHMAVNAAQRADETQICVQDPRNEAGFQLLAKKVYHYGAKLIVQLSQAGNAAAKVP